MRQLSFITLFFFLHLGESPQAQQCINRFTSAIYKSVSWDSFTHAISTPSGEWIAAGDIIDDHGFLAKFSAKGTPLFSYQYNPIYQNNTTYFQKLRFRHFVSLKNGGLAAAGSVVVDRWVFQNEYKNGAGFILKTDAFGNVLWCKKMQTAIGFNNNGFELAATNIAETPSGDLIAYVASDFGSNYAAYGKAICFSGDGKQKWMTILGTADYDGGLESLEGKRAILSLQNQTVVLAEVANRSDRRTNQTLSSALHIFGLQTGNGSLLWERFYELPLSATRMDISSAQQLGNGRLVFTLSFVAAAGGTAGLRVRTEADGNSINATQYTIAGSANTQLIDATLEPGGNRQTYLLKTDAGAALVAVNESGGAVWEQGFSHSGGLFPASCVASANQGFALFMSSKKNRDMRILFTDERGGVRCANDAVQISTKAVVLTGLSGRRTETNLSNPTGFLLSDFPLKKDVNPLEKRVECEETASCCHDQIDSVSNPLRRICEGTQLNLPTGIVVNQTGQYYVSYKTAGGCDSLVFYRVIVDKNPAALTLGPDLCLEEKDSLLLQATEGYDVYRWMAGPSSRVNNFVVRKAGSYWVTVTNICGSKTDTLTVYKECDFPLFMPTAFTPNGDGRNDRFGVSTFNKNNFVSLTIFNRWGQVVFASRSQDDTWDGTHRNLPQPTGAYVYQLQMTGLSGRPLMQAGTVLLIR